MFRKAKRFMRSSDYEAAASILYQAVCVAMKEFWSTYRIVAASADAFLAFSNIIRKWSSNPERFFDSWITIHMFAFFWHTKV